MFERNTLRQATFWAAVFVIVAANFFAYRSFTDLLAAGRQADEAQYTRYRLEHVSSLLKDAETSQRGYLLSGDEAYLEPYRHAVAEVPGAMAELRGLVESDDGRMGELQALVTEQLAALGGEVGRRGVDGMVAFDGDAFGRAKDRMDRIRGLVGDLVADEERAISLLGESVGRRADMALLLLVAGTVLSIAAIVAIFLWINAEVSRRRRLERELKQLNADLERRVETRTAELADLNSTLLGESEQRLAVAESLRDSNDLLNAVIGATPLAVALLDRQDRVIVWNAAAERIFGYGQDEVLGHLSPVTGRDIEGAPIDFVALAKAAGPQGSDAELARKDGSAIHARLLAAPITGARAMTDAAGGASSPALLILVEDATARLSVEQQLRQAQKMEVIGQLTGGIAHDFNNLLTIIVGNGDLALEKAGEDSGLSDYLKAVLRAAGRGADLTQRLLAFARKQTLRPRVVDVNTLLPSLSAMLKRVLGENIAVSNVQAGDLWPALADPSQIEDAILNLAINARDAMPKGGRLVIETRNVSLDEDYVALNPEAVAGDYVMFSVADSGHGMTGDVLQRAFEPFFTTKELGKGTGLGLSMIYGFVKQSGGHIKIYSEVGHGTTVRIYLPRARPQDGELADAPPIPAAAPSGRETVLVVEDNVEVRRVAVRIMRELGYRVIEAETADAAEALLSDGAEADVLFTDIVMPGNLNGYDLAQMATARNPRLKVLFTSGYSEVFLRQGAGGLRAELIGKPYRKQELAVRLRAALDAVD